MNLKFQLSIVIMILFMTSCKPKENTTIAKEIVVTEIKKDQTVFFFFEVVKKDQDTYKITILKQQITKAKLKGIFNKEIPIENRENKHWLIRFKDINQNSIQIQITNPLVQKYEVGSIDGTISGGTVSHDKAQFMVRIPYNTTIETIVFEKIIQKGNKLDTVFLDQISL